MEAVTYHLYLLYLGLTCFSSLYFLRVFRRLYPQRMENSLKFLGKTKNGIVCGILFFFLNFRSFRYFFFFVFSFLLNSFNVNPVFVLVTVSIVVYNTENCFACRKCLL